MNYLNNVAARVGLGGNPPPCRRQQWQRGGEDNDEYDPRDHYGRQGHRGGEDNKEFSLMSYGSRRTANRDINLLAGAQQREMQDGGRAPQGANRCSGQPPQRALGGIPDEINNNNMLDIGSQVTGGLDGGDQETVGGDGGGPTQPAGGHPGRQQPCQGPGGAIAVRLQAIPTRRDDALKETLKPEALASSCLHPSS
jgi:hypothetical protein